MAFAVYGLAVWQFGLAYTAIPFVFVIGGGVIKDILAPMDWSIMTSVEGNGLKLHHYTLGRWPKPFIEVFVGGLRLLVLRRRVARLV